MRFRPAGAPITTEVQMSALMGSATVVKRIGPASAPMAVTVMISESLRTTAAQPAAAAT